MTPPGSNQRQPEDEPTDSFGCCPECGQSIEADPTPKRCPECGELLADHAEVRHFLK